MTQEAIKRGYHHGDLRNALIQAGQELLAEEGIGGLELRKVARRAGVSHAAPYRHFADKQALLAAIAETGFQQLGTAIQTAVAHAPDDVWAQLEQTGLTYVRFARDHPALIREMFSGLGIDREAFPTLYATSKAAFWQIAEVIRRGQEQHLITERDPNEQTFVLWSTIHGLAMLLVENQIPAEYTADIEQTVRMFIQTLRKGLELR